MNQQPYRAELIESIVRRFETHVNEFLQYAELHPEAYMAELESEAQRLSHDCFAPALEVVVQRRKLDAQASAQCSCGEVQRYKGEQRRSQETYVGRIEWHRGYYYCSACKKGSFPLDEAMGIAPGAFSEGLQSGISRLGASLPFRAASETFCALTGVSISDREGERVTERRGAALEAHLDQEREFALVGGQAQPTSADSPEEPGVWAVSLDAAKVRFEDGWHEAKAGVVFWAKPRLESEGAVAREQSYVVEVGPMEEAGARLYAEAIRRGIDASSELVVCLGDGAPGNWTQFGLHFPRRVEILDWYHAVEHLWAAGNGVFGEGEAKAWVEKRKTELWDGKVEEVIGALRYQAARSGGRAAQDEIHYFETNKQRMRYQAYRSQSYPIGSGTVESACKRVIGARAKQAGMCWSQPGAQAVLSLRAELLSGRWDQAWQVTRPLRNAA